MGGFTESGPAKHFPLCSYLFTIPESSIPVAYNFNVVSTATGEPVSPLKWELQGDRGESNWLMLDARKVSESCRPTWIAFIPPHSMGLGFTSFRLCLREVEGCRGSHSISYGGQGGLFLSSMRVWVRRPGIGSPSIPLCLPGWSLSISGTWGCRRLRVTTSEGAIDIVSTGVINAERGSLPFHLGLCVSLRNPENPAGEQRGTWNIVVCINGSPIEMVPVHFCFTSPLYKRGVSCVLNEEYGSHSRESNESLGDFPLAHTAPAPPPYLSMAGPLWDKSEYHLVMGSCKGEEACLNSLFSVDRHFRNPQKLPAWLVMRNSSEKTFLQKSNLPRDAPRDSFIKGALAALSGLQMWNFEEKEKKSDDFLQSALEILKGAWESARASPPPKYCSAPPHGPSAAAPCNTPLFSQPIKSFEYVVLWQPRRYGFYPQVSPLVRRYVPPSQQAHKPPLMVSPDDGMWAQGCAAGYFSPSKPVVLLCHDCGPSVYAEDAWFGGGGGG